MSKVEWLGCDIVELARAHSSMIWHESQVSMREEAVIMSSWQVLSAN